MNIIVLQHIPIEDPGYIKDLMLADGWILTTIELDAGEVIPDDLSSYDAMLCMGGPMDTWMEEQYPWLSEEKKRISEFVIDAEKPFLGFCLGAQLLGEVIGGNVVQSSPPEIGILDINFNSDKSTDPLFCEFPDTIKALQWHSWEVAGLEHNPHTTLLASSPTTQNQVFKYKNHAYGIQFHIEVKDQTVSGWGCVPEYKQALEQSLGNDALADFELQTNMNLPAMNNCARLLYESFKSSLESSAA